MSHLNGYQQHQPISDAEWRELEKVAAGELTPGAVANVLRRVIGNFEKLSTDHLRQRCADLVAMREQWQV